MDSILFLLVHRKRLKIDSYSFDQEAILLSGNNAKGIFSVKYYKGKFDAYQRTYIITINDAKQLFYQYFLYELFLKLELLRRQSIGATTKYHHGFNHSEFRTYASTAK